MPVSTAISAGMWVLGFTRVWNSPSTSPPQTFTAPNSVIVSSPVLPVVSRSTTQNVTCDSGRPRSSKLGCAKAAVVTGLTLGPAADNSVSAARRVEPLQRRRR